MALCRTSRRLPMRAIIAGVFACLFVLHALALAVYPAFAAKAGNSAGLSFIVSTNDGRCDALGSDKVPAQGRHDPSECCLFCKTSGRDASFANIVASIGIVTYWPPETIVSLVRFIADASSKPPIGWASSWSSRAPPRV